MSVIDKALAAVTPQPNEEKRAEATQKARAAASPGDWLSLALDHHDQIRAAFAEGVQRLLVANQMVGQANMAIAADLIRAGAEAGADYASFIMLRLPLEVAPLFEDWLERRK